jgi:hypothetical protein
MVDASKEVNQYAEMWMIQMRVEEKVTKERIHLKECDRILCNAVPAARSTSRTITIHDLDRALVVEHNVCDALLRRTEEDRRTLTSQKLYVARGRGTMVT